jgi:hypothetical protein
MGYVYTDEKAQRLIRNYGSIISFCLLLVWFEIMILRPSSRIGIEMVCTVKFSAAAVSLFLLLLLLLLLFLLTMVLSFFRMISNNLNDTSHPYFLPIDSFFSSIYSFLIGWSVPFLSFILLLLSANNK